MLVKQEKERSVDENSFKARFPSNIVEEVEKYIEEESNDVSDEAPESAYDKAWKNYCSGEQLTDEDTTIIEQSRTSDGFRIPEKFVKGCIPPK